MKLKDSLILNGYDVPTHAESIVFHKPGKARVEKVITPKDVYEYSLKNSKGRWGVLVQPLIVGLCPTDQTGGNLSFPPGSIRSLGNPNCPAVAGHEFTGKVVAANQKSMKQLFQRGIKLGDMVVGDINVGCAECFQCSRNDPPIYCNNGTAFIGIGNSANSSWVGAQTGRPHVPGAYTKGFVVLPASNVYKIPIKDFKNINQLAVFSQADAVACSKTSCDAMGITNFEQMRGFNNPNVLIIGAGRTGAWHAAIAKKLLPNIRIYLADIDKDNLNMVGSLLDIPKNQRYLISKDSDNPYSRDNLKAAFGKDYLFDFIIDTAGHDAFDGKTITRLLQENIANGGAFCTNSHIGVSGIDAGHSNLILGMKRFVNGLSPQNNFEFALSFLSSNLKRYAPFMSEIRGGLSQKLAQIVATGGEMYKKQMEGTTFYSVVNHINF